MLVPVGERERSQSDVVGFGVGHPARRPRWDRRHDERHRARTLRLLIGKVVLITGASRGIGAAASRPFTAEAVARLLSDRASMMTGASVPVDGGSGA